MGKRVEKAPKDKVGQSPPQETPEEDANKTPEPYTCTGVLEADFHELCLRAGMPQTEIPPVVLRSRRPGTPPPPDLKKEDPKGKNQPPPEPTPDPKEETEPPPKSYVVKDKYDFFRPTIQVEMEHDDKPATVTEIHIRGWRIDDRMMAIFKQCFPTMDKLTTIHFWKTGLTEDTVKELASILPQCSSLRNISIEGNPCEEEPWALLLSGDSLIANLSLRHNGITDRGATAIGEALSTERACNKSLQTLGLSYNKITHVGAAALVNGLRMNRILLSLSLANNVIGDDGAVQFGEVLSRFPLTHSEVVERRKLMSVTIDFGSGKSPPPSRRDKDRPGSVKSGANLDKGDKRRNKSSTKKDGKKDKEESTKGGKKDDKWKKAASKASLASMAETTKATKGKKTAASKDKKGAHDAETPDPSESLNPLTTESPELIDGQLWIPGNRALINLNLARNGISDVGMKALLLAVQYQTTLCNLSHHPILKGLMKLSLQGNAVPKTNEHLVKIQELMDPKDPFYKPQAMSPPGENHSTAG